MVKKAAALFLVCASMAIWVSCGSTSGNYLYVAIPGSNEIVVYREDPNSGILTQLVGSPVTAGQAVQSIVVHPSRKFLCAANTGEGDVSIFTIAANGGLTEVTPRTVVGTAPTLLAMDSAGSYLYVGNSGSFNISVFSITATGTTPTLTEVAGSPFPIGMSPINMEVAPSGGFLYVTGAGAQSGFIEAFSLNNGILTPLAASPFNTGANPYGLAIDVTPSNGSYLYTANNLNGGSISEFTINADGSLTQFANSPFGSPYPGPFALLIDKSATYLYVANQASSFVTAYSIGSNGALTGLTSSPFATGSGPSVLATDPGGKYLFVGNQKTGSAAIQSFSLDPGSGTLTSVATYTLPGTPSSIGVTP